MEVGADGIIRAKQELTDLQKDTGIEVVPFKELKNMEQLGVLIGVTETKLNDARKQARGLQGELRFAKANNESRETIENIRQMIRDNSDLQDSLESNLAFIKANGQAYVEQVQSVQALTGATKVLSDTIKDMQTASAAKQELL